MRGARRSAEQNRVSARRESSPCRATMRWAIVGGAARNALAISSVVSPQTSRSVSATWVLGGKAGWQHVKISRRRSSSSSSSPLAALAPATVASRLATSRSEASNRARLRIASTALKRPVETSHARGFAGTPVRGQVSTAAANASWSASSARSKSPSKRTSVANTRRDSER